MNRTDASKCLMNGCKNKAFSRGLCQSCLGAARTAISRGKVTDAELVKNGMMLPAKKRGRKATNPMTKALGALRSKSK